MMFVSVLIILMPACGQSTSENSSASSSDEKAEEPAEEVTYIGKIEAEVRENMNGEATIDLDYVTLSLDNLNTMMQEFEKEYNDEHGFNPHAVTSSTRAATLLLAQRRLLLAR